MRKAMQKAAPYIGMAGEMLYSCEKQRIATNAIKSVFDFYGELIAKVRALIIVPFSRLGDFQVGGREPKKNQAFAL
jgi:hypothetical protein